MRHHCTQLCSAGVEQGLQWEQGREAPELCWHPGLVWDTAGIGDIELEPAEFHGGE